MNGTGATAGSNSVANFIGFTFASGLVSAGGSQVVVLDNLQVRAAANGSQGFEISGVHTLPNFVVSSVATRRNSSTGYNIASINGGAWAGINVPLGSWRRLHNAAFSGVGSSLVSLVQDLNLGHFYRVTAMIGAGFQNQVVTIEKLRG